MSLQGKKVLVTGGTGFIGGRLVERLILEWGAQVRVLVRNFSRAVRVARFPIEMVPGDAADVDAVNHAAKGCDVIFHCAYGAADTAEKQKTVALKAVESVAEAALENKVSRLVHVSTFSVYGSTPDGDLAETARRQRTGDTYTDSKIAAEERVLEYHRRHKLPVVVVQPTVVYGPFGWVWTVCPVLQLRSSRVALVNGGLGLCNAVYVDDVVEGMYLAAIREQAIGETFLLSGSEPVTWQDLYSSYEKILGIQSTLSMTVEEIRAELSRQKKARGTVAQLRRAIHSPKVHKKLRKLPVVSKLTTDGFWEKLEQPQTEQTEKPLYAPPEPQLPMFTAKTRIRIEKAREKLGYQPQFDFRRGMDLTAKWIAWANLLDR